MASRSKEIIIKGEVFWLIAERALFWPKYRLLAVADLHWGKVGTFRKAGIPVPHAVEIADLKRLKALIASYEAKHMVVLGDLVHHRDGLTDQLFEQITAWRSEITAEISLVKGNHDRWLKQLPDEWCMQVFEKSLPIEDFVFSHHPKEEPSRYVWAGHIHPSITMQGRGDRLRLPCFHIGPRVGVLPAFSEFTGGGIIDVRQKEQIFAIAGDDVVAVSHSDSANNIV